jgi:hypothetical protein
MTHALGAEHTSGGPASLVNKKARHMAGLFREAGKTLSE